MLIQRRAAERRLTVCLRGANEELRFLLVLTKLDDLFELESGGGCAAPPWPAGGARRSCPPLRAPPPPARPTGLFVPGAGARRRAYPPIFAGRDTTYVA